MKILLIWDKFIVTTIKILFFTEKRIWVKGVLYLCRQCNTLWGFFSRIERNTQMDRLSKHNGKCLFLIISCTRIAPALAKWLFTNITAFFMAITILSWNKCFDFLVSLLLVDLWQPAISTRLFQLWDYSSQQVDVLLSLSGAGWTLKWYVWWQFTWFTRPVPCAQEGVDPMCCTVSVQ